MLFPPAAGTKHISITIWKTTCIHTLKAQQNGYIPCAQLLSGQGFHIRFTKANLQGHKKEIKTYKETMLAERDCIIRLDCDNELTFFGRGSSLVILISVRKRSRQIKHAVNANDSKDTQTFQATISSKDQETEVWISHAYTCAITNIGHQARDSLVFT